MEHKHLGVYGLVINDNKILLINKVSGPYDGKLDLPGGSIEFGETLDQALKREFREEVGIFITDYSLFDADSVKVIWNINNKSINIHHVGIFYKILNYEGEVNSKIELDSNNDDSLGANFYDIDSLNKNDLSLIVILELEKLGYKIKKTRV